MISRVSFAFFKSAVLCIAPAGGVMASERASERWVTSRGFRRKAPLLTSNGAFFISGGAPG